MKSIEGFIYVKAKKNDGGKGTGVRGVVKQKIHSALDGVPFPPLSCTGLVRKCPYPRNTIWP